MEEVKSVYVFEAPSRVLALIFSGAHQLILCTETSVYLYDVQTLQYTNSINFGEQVSPISIHRIQQSEFLVQSKEGKLVFLSKKQNQLGITKIIRTQILGFTKINLLRCEERVKVLYFNDETQSFNLFDLNDQSEVAVPLEDVSNVTSIQVRKHQERYHVYVFTEGVKIYQYSISLGFQQESLKLINTWSIQNLNQNFIIQTTQHQNKIFGIMRKSGIVSIDTTTGNIEIINKNKFQYRKIIAGERVYLVSTKVVRSNYENFNEETTLANIGKSPVTDVVLENKIIVSAYENGLVSVIRLSLS